MKETICAISTPAGLGAIALIRATGDDAFARIAPVFARSFALEDLQPLMAKYTEIYEEDQLIDQVVVTKFVAPRSYTGENMVEISCHGSLFIQKKIIEMLLAQGCHLAGPGEFTQRAFLNGKLDLPQAEAIADLIDSQSESAHKLAINQLCGHLSKKINHLREEFIQLASLVELELDFSEEEVEFADRDELRHLLGELQAEVEQLIHSFQAGNALKNGIPVAIVGKPNVGKSTLLNALLKNDRAIVSHIPGTTRDTIEDTLLLNGTLFRFIDTAGIRQSDDEVENFGIERTFQAVEKASIILYLVDICTPSNEVQQEIDLFKEHIDLSDKELILLANKMDTLTSTLSSISSDNMICISAKEQINLHQIETKLQQYVERFHIQDQSLLTNERHYALLTDINLSIRRIYEGLDRHIPTDLLAEEVRVALHALGELTGTISTNDILHNIFGKFCIGK